MNDRLQIAADGHYLARVNGAAAHGVEVQVEGNGFNAHRGLVLVDGDVVNAGRHLEGIVGILALQGLAGIGARQNSGITLTCQAACSLSPVTIGDSVVFPVNVGINARSKAEVAMGVNTHALEVGVDVVALVNGVIGHLGTCGNPARASHGGTQQEERGVELGPHGYTSGRHDKGVVVARI